MLLFAAGAAIASDSTIGIGLAISGGVGLVALGGWSAVLRHRQDQHGRDIEKVRTDYERDVRRLVRRVDALEVDKERRDAVRDFRQGRDPTPSRPRPGDTQT